MFLDPAHLAPRYHLNHVGDMLNGVPDYHVPSQVPRELRRYSGPRRGMIVYWTRCRW